MKRTLLFVLALIAVGCAEPTPRNLDDLPMQGPQYLDPETLEPYSGPAYRMSEDDSTQIVLRVNLRDGRFHGDYEDFAPEAVEGGLGLYQTGTYRDGQREGRYEVFYLSGVLRGHGIYENDELNGPYESYYEDGQLLDKSTYVAGERDGPYEAYHWNGQLWQEIIYSAGELDGPAEFYYENGQLRVKGTYNMGEECGEWIYGDGATIVDLLPRFRFPCPPDPEDGN